VRDRFFGAPYVVSRDLPGLNRQKAQADSSDDGPQKRAPALVPAGMMGDRASLVFATPDEISTWIEQQCQ